MNGFLTKIIVLFLFTLTISIKSQPPDFDYENSSPVLWTQSERVDADPMNGGIKRQPGYGSGWNAGGISTERIELGEDGWFEITVGQIVLI